MEDAQIISSYTCQLDENNNNDYNIYKILNLNLNSNSKEEGIKKVSKYLYIFLKSLRKLPLYYPESGYLYKCIPIHIEQNSIKDDGGKIVPYAVGNQKTFWGFVSVFSNIVESYKYLGNKDKFKTGTIFNLVGNAWGYDISLFNIYGEEDILLDPERKFEVIESRPPIKEIIDVRCEIKDTNLILENIFGIVEIRLIYLCKSKGVENIFGEEFVENNKNNIDIVINEKKSSPLINKCELNKGENMIKLIIKKKLVDLHEMFSGCKALLNIEDLKNLDVQFVTDFSFMFYNCVLLSNINGLENWNVTNSQSFEGMFCQCYSLSDKGPIKNWNVSNCKNFGRMFSSCESLNNIWSLSDWNVSNCTNFEYMFCYCSH